MPHEHGTITHHVVHEYHGIHRGTYFSLSQFVYWTLGIVEILLGIRFVFRFFGANPSATFVTFIYGLTDGLVAPFRFIFPVTVENGAVVEWSTLLAMVIYAVLAWVIFKLIDTIRAATHKDMTEEEEMEAEKRE